MPGRIKRPRRRAGSAVVGIDTGGTFTDLVAMVDGQLRVHKLPSTPQDPAEAVFRGLEALLGETAGAAVTYSSTVATNTLLEKNGARVALVTDRGFEDLIEIGRQNRIELYALAPSRVTPLIPRELRFGVGGRTFFDGQIESPLRAIELTQLRATLKRRKVDAIAISLLHSYANPQSEQAIARVLAPLGIPLSISHRILPEYREYERLSTTVVNAYVAPRMVAHLAALETQLGNARLRVMQSNGGAIGVALARAEPVRTILSGPAAGVVGAAALVGSLGLDRFITFDMGGTSTDVAMFDRRARLRTLSYPGGYPVRTPVIDIHTVGAGGGSLAALDAGGSLKVGPESVGANPGPACYGRGTAPAVTDADMVAGRLVADNFLGGAMRLYPERATRVLTALGRAMKTDASAAARGVIRVVNANMERAIRVITVERGFDPRDFALLAFGGAGPMHACELALELGIRHVVMPRNPGLLCGWGALGAPLGRELSLTIRDAAPDLRALERRARPMIARARADLLSEGVAPASIRHELWADLRYRGQAYEIEVQLGPHFVRDFHERHRQTFGHATPEAPVEVVNLRVRASSAGPPIAPERIARLPRPAPLTSLAVLTGNVSRTIPVYAREALGAGLRLNGPLIVVELSATTYVAPEFAMRLDDYGNLHLELR
jgi:N-methylhydantoinase A/oxoprolinase/acetone carboxylase beta subunit